jgi:triosephosphate isomerase (TIM)
MTRRPVIAGNWKMNLSADDALSLAGAVRDRCGRFRDVDVVIAPQGMMLWPIARRLEGSPIGLAAQNCHWAEKGAYTGEFAPAQLNEAGCTHVIIGHSERRQYFGETDEGVGKKARAIHDAGMTPILCVGETLAQREAKQTIAIVSAQVSAGIAHLSHDEVAHTIIAYEPVWAIGTGRTASPEQAQDVHLEIRTLLGRLTDKATADRVRLQYGGSVKPSNVRELMSQPDIDGALVGGASLTIDSFAQLVAHREDFDQ